MAGATVTRYDASFPAIRADAMKRRSRAGGKPPKARPRKALTVKGRKASKAVTRRGSPPGAHAEVARLTRELKEAQEQQAATADLLKVISQSGFNLQVVLDTLVQSAARLCEAEMASVVHPEGSVYRSFAHYGYSQNLIEFMETHPVHLGRGTVTGRTILECKPVQIPDVLADPEFTFTEVARIGGMRTMLGVPLLRDGVPMGVFVLSRRAVRPFSEKQIELVQNFSAQAVIAIENARLLTELRGSLQEQTATSEVLQVINSSSGDLEPVFAAMLEKAIRICDANFGNIYRWDGEVLHLLASHNTPPALAEARKHSPLRPFAETPVGRMVAHKAAFHSADMTAMPGYIDRSDPGAVAAVELGGVRTILAIPMLKENEMIGSFSLYRQEVRPFTDKQIALVTNFAAQAVIAIENARLLTELRESLQEQTATSEVLQVLSSFPGDLQPVFDAMLEKAARICDATFGNIYRWDGDTLHLVGTHNTPLARRRSQIRPNPRMPVGRMLATKKTVHIADLAADPVYTEERDPTIVAGVELGGIRTFLLVPMLKENELIGVFSLYRQEVRPFTEKQIALVTNFAAQAVIAIENARLLNELRQSLEEQTATSEVLQVISSSPGDLEPVFAAMLEKAVRICDAKFGNIYRWDGEMLVLVATQNTPPEFAEVRRSRLLRHTPNDPVGRMIGTKSLVHTADLSKEPEYIERSNPALIAAVEVGGVRTSLQVPILKEDELIGALSLSRQEVRPFTDKQIELLKNFAAQAVIAIENARLLKELRGRTEEVEKLNYHLEQRVVDQVGEIERMGRLRRFLPPQVADLIVASGTEKQLESHRREITALFCDLRGFTGFSESADPEDVMTLLRDYHAAIGEIIIKYSGTLERYAGDGVMVVFNDPVPVEKPALQAVMMALEMREAIGGLTGNWRELGHEIGFGIGIAHGYATLGTIGFEGRFDYAAIGTVSNVASRLCDEAKPGQILISPRVLMAVKDAVTVEPVGEFELKGIRRPIAAYNVLVAASPKTD